MIAFCDPQTVGRDTNNSLSDIRKERHKTIKKISMKNKANRAFVGTVYRQSSAPEPVCRLFIDNRFLLCGVWGSIFIFDFFWCGFFRFSEKALLKISREYIVWELPSVWFVGDYGKYGSFWCLLFGFVKFSCKVPCFFI